MKSIDSSNSGNQINADDAFENLLSRELKNSADYIDDQGFTANLMNRLPKQRKISKWLEWSILLVPSLLVAFLVLTQLELNSSLLVAVAVLKSLSFTQMILLAAGSTLLFVTAIVWWVTQEKS